MCAMVTATHVKRAVRSACVVALGEHAAGVFSNDDELAGEIVASGKCVRACCACLLRVCCARACCAAFVSALGRIRSGVGVCARVYVVTVPFILRERGASERV